MVQWLRRNPSEDFLQTINDDDSWEDCWEDFLLTPTLTLT